MICERSTKTSELAERLRTELLARRLPSGSPVTSVRELASLYGVSTVTADKILNLLVKEDFLYRIPQSGTFIKHDPPVVPVIGYAGHLPGPGATDIIQAAAAKRLEELPPEEKFTPAPRFFAWLSRRSLAVYLLHQPVLLAVTALLESATRGT